MIDSPGARSDKNDEVFEKYETVSASEVEPTLTADEIHAGAVSDVVDPLLPLAAKMQDKGIHIRTLALSEVMLGKGVGQNVDLCRELATLGMATFSRTRTF